MEQILRAALDAVDPASAVLRYARRDQNLLMIDGQVYPIQEFDNIFLLGVGKASLGMAFAMDSLVQDKLAAGVVVTKNLPPVLPKFSPNVSLYQGGHPIPNQESVEGATRMLDLVSQTTQRDLVICLISGGGSALISAPEQGITLEDLRNLTALLLASGATIHEMNILRKHLDRVKGGGILKTAYPAQVVTLILSDVIGNNLESIASGPTAPDPSTYADALDILKKYQLTQKIPPRILEVLREGLYGTRAETLKSDDPELTNVQNVLIGSNRQAAEAALQKAKTLGINTWLITDELQGEARRAGVYLSEYAKTVDRTGKPIPRPACLIAGGETTVTLQGSGKGGRNQEVALGAVAGMEGIHNAYLVTLGTDGEDGPTDAAGAVVTGETLSIGREKGLDPDTFLLKNDSYHYFDPLDGLLRPGPTGTNVNDLNFIFLF